MPNVFYMDNLGPRVVKDRGEFPIHAILSKCANVLRHADPALSVVLPTPLPSVPEILALLVPRLEEIQNAEGGPTLAATRRESPIMQEAHLLAMGMMPVPADPVPAQAQKESQKENEKESENRNKDEKRAPGLPILTDEKATATGSLQQEMTREQRARLRDAAANMD